MPNSYSAAAILARSMSIGIPFIALKIDVGLF